MAVRSESVRLSLEDAGFTTGMAKAAAAAAALDRSLNDLDGSSVKTQRSMAPLGTPNGPIGGIDKQSKQAETSINQLTGRLKLFTDLAVTVGPGLIPIGAVGVPAVTGLAAQFGFAALGAGTLVASLQGVGDAFKAVEAARLDPTVANLEKAREAMAKLGPDARRFVRELQDFMPTLKSIRDAGAEGWMPGLTESLENLERLGPRVADIFETIGAAGGELLADATESLAGERWAGFLTFVEENAPQALTELGRTVGDFTHGLAEMWMAFDPLNDDFSSWMMGVADGFDEWATGLAATDGFAELVDYIRTTGPQVGDTLAALGDAFLQIIEAAAPLGGPVLAALEAVAKVVAAFADSDLGTPILTGLAAMTLLSRATQAWGAIGKTAVGQFIAGQRTAQSSLATTTARMQALGKGSSLAGFAKGAALLGGLTIASTGAADGLGLTNTASLGLMGTLAGPWGAALGSAAGFALDAKSANDELTDSLLVAQAALDSGDTARMREQLQLVRTELNESRDALTGDGSIKDAIGDAFNPATWADVFNPKAANDLIAMRASLQDSIRMTREWREALNAQGGGGIEDALAGPLDLAFMSAERFANSLNRINGILSGRSSMRDYQAALDAATASLETNGKTLDINTEQGRANQASLDSIAASALGVAENMKEANRAEFLKSVAPQLEAAARGFGLTEKEAGALATRLLGLNGVKVQPTVELRTEQLQGALRTAGISMSQLDSLRANPKADLAYGQFMAGQINVKQLMRVLNGLKADPKVDAQTGAADRKLNAVERLLADLGATTSRPTADLNDRASGKARGVQAAINAIQGKTVTVTTVVRTVRQGPGPGRNTAGGLTADADGGFHENGVRKFADGGFGIDGNYYSRTPQIVRGGANILWGEEETGWEAYISGKPGMRERNISVMREAGARLNVDVTPLATGGLRGDFPSASLPYASTTAVFREFNATARGASAELYRNTRAQQAEGKMRLRLLEKEQERDQKEMEAQRDKLDLLKQERASLRDSIADRLKSDIYAQGERSSVKLTRPEGADNWSAEQERAFAMAEYNVQQSLSPTTNPNDILRQDIAAAREMADLLKTLKQRGLDGSALASLAADGNIDQIRSFAGGSTRDLREFERLFNQRERLTMAAGNVGGNAVFGQSIAAQTKVFQAAQSEYRETTKEVREMNRRLDRIEKQNEKNPVRTGQAVGQALDKVADNARRNGKK